MKRISFAVLFLLLITPVYAALTDDIASTFKDMFSNPVPLLVNAVILFFLFLLLGGLATKLKLGNLAASTAYQILAVLMALILSFVITGALAEKADLKLDATAKPYLWEWKPVAKYFHLKLLVNFAIIFTAFLITFNLILRKETPGSLQIFAYIFIAIIAFNLTVFFDHPDGFDVETGDYNEALYRYVWQKPWAKRAIFFFLGGEQSDSWGKYYTEREVLKSAGDDTRIIQLQNSKVVDLDKKTGYGILTGYMLLVFLVSTVLFYLLFDKVVKFSERDWIKWVISGIFAAFLANGGMVGPGSIFWLSIITAWILFGTTMAQNGMPKKFAFVASGFLVFTLAYLLFGSGAFGKIADEISAKATGDDCIGPPTGKAFASITGLAGACVDGVCPEDSENCLQNQASAGLAGNIWDIIWTTLTMPYQVIPSPFNIFFYLIAISMFGYWIFGKFKSDDDKEKKQSRTAGYVKNWFERFMSRGALGHGIGWDMFKQGSIADEEHAFFKDLRHEFNVLQNLIARYNIFEGKKGEYEKHGETIKKAYDKLNHYDREELIELYMTKIYGQGFEITEYPDPRKLLSNKLVPYVQERAPYTDMGYLADTLAAITRIIVSHHINKVRPIDLWEGKPLFGADRHGLRQQMEDQAKAILDNVETKKTEAFGDLDDGEIDEIGYLQEYGFFELSQSILGLVYDQYMPGGLYSHTYHFAPRNAPTIPYVKMKKRANAMRAYTPTETPEHLQDYVEVDTRGRVMDEVNRAANGEDIIVTVLTNPSEIVVLNKPVKPKNILDSIGQDWEGFLDDLRDGRYHAKSRSMEDYRHVMREKQHIRYQPFMHKKRLLTRPFRWKQSRQYHYFTDKVKKRHGDSPSESDPAMDYEAFNNHAKATIYAGRKRWFDTQNYINEGIDNGFPMLSTRGLTEFLRHKARITVDIDEQFLKDLKRFPRDLGGDDFKYGPWRAGDENE